MCKIGIICEMFTLTNFLNLKSFISLTCYIYNDNTIIIIICLFIRRYIHTYKVIPLSQYIIMNTNND